MKKVISILVLFIAINIYGQDNCQKLKAENEKLNTELKQVKDVNVIQRTKIENLKKELTYYKETLELLNTKDIKKSEDIIYRINSVKGSSDNGIITIEGLVENKGAVKSFQGQSNELTDPKGNNYIAHASLVVGKNSFGDIRRIDKFQKNIPTKFSISFKEIKEEMPVIKALVIKIYNKQNPIIFKNLPVTWE